MEVRNPAQMTPARAGGCTRAESVLNNINTGREAGGSVATALD
jgi:hypothetical protein